MRIMVVEMTSPTRVVVRYRAKVPRLVVQIMEYEKIAIICSSIFQIEQGKVPDVPYPGIQKRNRV